MNEKKNQEMFRRGCSKCKLLKAVETYKTLKLSGAVSGTSSQLFLNKDEINNQ
jgi:hypothetical protein